MDRATDKLNWTRRRWLTVLIGLLMTGRVAGSGPYSSQSRIFGEYGHLFFECGENSNVTLRTSGLGYVNINDQNIMNIINSVQKSVDVMKKFETSISSQMPSLSNPTALSLLTRLRKLESSIPAIGTLRTNKATATRRRLIALKFVINSMSNVFRRIENLLTVNECASSPCVNGGTCNDLFNGFHCHCTSAWMGSRCEIDVNECEELSGTGLGCKNGATCKNVNGSYICICPPGWYGLHCSERTYDCNRQSSQDLCGHGICVNQGGTGRHFICICDEGWTTKEGDGTCTVDKNECDALKHPCSHDPYVECQNIPGSFTCGSCPAGYSGNGRHCTDIDECQINNGGCSTSPMVQCINLRGSRICGPCPPGFIGDGVTCTAGGKCQINNGGCHPLAVCVDNSALSYAECRCTPGYVGTGVGINGCVLSHACDNSPCINGGTCIPTQDGRYTCKCAPSFTGVNCSESNDLCRVSPCLNGGTCKVWHLAQSNSYVYCVCPQGFKGRNCENKEEG